MGKGITFGLGAAAGAVGGVVVTLALTGGETPPAATLAGDRSTRPAAQAPAGDPAPLPAAPHTALPSAPPADGRDSEAAGPPGHTPPPDPPATAAGEDAAAARTALAEAMARAEAMRESKPAGKHEQWRQLGRELVDWNPAAPKYQELFRQALIDLHGTDRRAAAGAGYALAWPGMQGRFSAEQLEELYRTLLTLLEHGEANGTYAPHHYGRRLELDPPIEVTDAPGWLAYVLAAGWKSQPDKLRRLTAQIPAHRHPTVHLGALTALGRHASDATRAYLMQLTRAATDPRVLELAWQRDGLNRVANRAWSGEFLSVLEGRLVRWDLPATLRAKGWHAGMACGIRVPERGAAMLRTAAGQEPDAGNRAFAGAAAQLLESGLIDGAALDALIRKHPPSGE